MRQESKGGAGKADPVGRYQGQSPSPTEDFTYCRNSPKWHREEPLINCNTNSNSTSIPTQHQSQLIINSNSTSITTKHQFQLNK
jgi:hypothetical protein